MRTGGNEDLDLFIGQGLWYAPFPFNRDNTCGLRLRFGNPIQQGFVCSAIRHGELVQRQLRNRPQAGVKHIEALNSPDGLVNGGIGAPRGVALNGEDRRVKSAQPGNEACQLCNIDLCPAEMRILEVFPKLFEVMGRGADRVGAAIQVVQELEVGKNWLDRRVEIVKDQLGDAVRVGKTHSLHLHCLHPFRCGNRTHVPFYKVQREMSNIRSIHCERARSVI